MKLLLLGSNGQLGWELQRSLSPLSKIFACDHITADINNLDSLKKLVRVIQGEIFVINFMKKIL